MHVVAFGAKDLVRGHFDLHEGVRAASQSTDSLVFEANNLPVTDAGGHGDVKRSTVTGGQTFCCPLGGLDERDAKLVRGIRWRGRNLPFAG